MNLPALVEDSSLSREEKESLMKIPEEARIMVLRNLKLLHERMLKEQLPEIQKKSTIQEVIPDYGRIDDELFQKKYKLIRLHDF